MKFGLFYQFPCATTQDATTRYQETIEQIVCAEELGCDTAWLAELHFNLRFSIMPAPLLVAAALTQRTSRIRLGTAVWLLPFQPPLRTAVSRISRSVHALRRLHSPHDPSTCQESDETPISGVMSASKSDNVNVE